jgi:hypothetical protein
MLSTGPLDAAGLGGNARRARTRSACASRGKIRHAPGTAAHPVEVAGEMLGQLAAERAPPTAGVEPAARGARYHHGRDARLAGTVGEHERSLRHGRMLAQPALHVG